MALAAAWLLPSAASATPSAACPSTGVAVSAITITQPKANATLTAGPQTLTGTVVNLTSVDLYVDGALTDSAQVDSSNGFSLSWQANATSPQSATLQVVGCGTGLGELVRGTASVTVRLVPGTTTTTDKASSTPTIASTAPGGRTLTTLSSATTAPAATVAPSSTTSTTPETTIPTPAVTTPPTTAAPDRPAPAPLVLTEGAGSHKPGPPLWVGAVVGISGTIGLAMSAVFARRRSAAASLPTEVVTEEADDLVPL